MARDYAPKTWEGLASQVARDVYKKVGNKIAKDMTHQYVKAIQMFYDDYHPSVYKRKRRSFYFIDPEGVKTYSKFVKMDADDKGFTVGIKLDPSNIRVPYSSIVSGRGTHRHEGHQFSVTEMVFYNTWVLGQHGGKLPYDIIPEDLRIPPEAVHAPNWKPLRTTGWTWIPPRMDVSPMELMDNWFAEYATNENLNKLTQNIVTASINRYITRANQRYGGIK